MKMGIYNHETGKQEVRDMTEEEVAAIEADTIVAAEKLAAEQLKATAKAALLDRLGISADEVALLLQ